ncbi:hypothetical protein M8J75_006562 [Diaphorina citri]|nr:hypothetical protein M8J75_006562 [Diaphorina citri]
MLYILITHVNKSENMADAAKSSGRPMEYPYTYSAKLARFPYKFYLTKQWIWKTMPFALLIVAPLYYKLSKLSNSPENVAKWKEIRRKELEGHHDD